MRLKHVQIIPFTKISFVLLFLQLPAQQRFSKLRQGQKHIIRIPHLTCLPICRMKITKHHVVFCSAYIPLNNYLVFNDVDGLYTYTFEAQRKVCRVLQITLSGNWSFWRVENNWIKVLLSSIGRKIVQPAARCLRTFSFLLQPNYRRY